jgi:aromatic-L-amino-acid decarboxylase
MFRYDEQMTNLVFDYCRNRLSLDPVPLDFSGEEQRLEAALAGLLGPEGNDPAEVMALFENHLAPAVISCDSPRFLAFIPAAPTRASLLFDMVVSCSSLQGSSWLEAAGAIAAENQALRLLADLAGLPTSAGGVFVSGGSAANLSALAVAREVARAERRIEGRPAVAVSDQVHSSVTNTLRMLDMDELVVPTTGHRLDGPALAAALDAAGDDSEVVAVVGTAGTTNAGIVDDLDGISRIAAQRGLWFHVDAAYGGAALFSARARPLFGGIENSDSLVIDPHKWLFAPFDCAGLLYRSPELAKRVHTQNASYLDPVHSGGDWNPSDYAFHLTRRARGLALWFSLAVHGTGCRAGARHGHALRATHLFQAVDGARAPTGAFDRPVSKDRLAPCRLQTVVLEPPRLAGRVRGPHDLGRRDGGKVRVLAPRDHSRDGGGDTHDDGVTTSAGTAFVSGPSGGFAACIRRRAMSRRVE